MAAYTSGYFKEDEETTIKDDLNSLKNFFRFVKKDIYSILKRENV